jgi:hypothetical protein
MKTYYFAGGPQRGQRMTFFRPLAEIGGSPPDRSVYPHANGDGQALHVVDAETEDVILAHLIELRADLSAPPDRPGRIAIGQRKRPTY